MQVTEALELRRKLEDEKDTIAREVYKLVDQQGAHLPETAQLQNLRTVAAGTESLEELKIYIYYQMSREIRNPPIDPQFGRALLQSIENLKPTGGNNDFWVEKVRLFLGYLARYARYARAEGERGARQTQEQRRGEGRR